ncbi:PadR family transcriptional regulator [Amycolatopsis palatopharyngis]|uniref:PadR family transcriptional regulator n=1 Tax=Amycolatopsis palatopharyngis TaxID=187982 RepID=UPI000E270A55|nr:PadR family transcriptional regulator [Amycolatopsis palatopharyngis]
MSRERLTITSFVVLGLIALRGPSTSYDLKRASGHSIGYFWPFPHAQLYSEPRKLAEAGLLTVEEETNGRRRQTFSITEEGREALAEWLNQPIRDPMQIRDVAELKLFFSELMDADTERRLAADQIAQHTTRLAEYRSIQERFGDRADVSSRMVPLDLGIALTEAALAFWVDLAERLDAED